MTSVSRPNPCMDDLRAPHRRAVWVSTSGPAGRPSTFVSELHHHRVAAGLLEGAHTFSVVSAPDPQGASTKPVTRLLTPSIPVPMFGLRAPSVDRLARIRGATDLDRSDDAYREPTDVLGQEAFAEGTFDSSARFEPYSWTGVPVSWFSLTPALLEAGAGSTPAVWKVRKACAPAPAEARVGSVSSCCATKIVGDCFTYSTSSLPMRTTPRSGKPSPPSTVKTRASGEARGQARLAHRAHAERRPSIARWI